MIKLPKEFIIFDTEYTAWEGSQARQWSGDGEEKELVQLGAIRVRDLEEVDSLLLYIQPTINPVLSEYFINLTGVTQADVNTNGVPFTEAYDAFMSFKGDMVGYCFGYDFKVLQRNHDLYHTSVQIDTEAYCDVRTIFQAGGIDTTSYMSSTIPTAFGLTPPPQGHDALNDARSILMALKALYTSHDV